MQLSEVTLTGFKAYPGTMRIQLHPNLTTITGSNGSGKSSVVSAVLFALNNIDNPSELVNNTCKVASVILKFSDKTKLERIYNKQTHINKFKINEQSVSSISYLKFLNQNNLSDSSFYAIQQGTITKLIGMTKQQMTDFIKQMANTKYYEEKANKSLIKLEEKENALKISKERINNTIAPFFYKLKQSRENLLSLQRKKELKIKIKQIQEKQIFNKLHKLKTQIFDKISQIKEEKEQKFVSKFVLTNKVDDIKKKMLNLCTEELKEEIQKKEEIKNNLVIESDDYLDLKKRIDLFSNEVSFYDEMTEAFSHCKALIYNIPQNDSFDSKLINLLKKEFSNLQENNFNSEFKRIEEIEKKLKKYKNIFLIKEKNKDIKELINKLKSNLSYPIKEDVYGKVIENISYDKKYSLAINAVLGNKMNFVIVKNEVIGSTLLNYDQPITVIPLNKITSIPNKLKNHTPLLSCINYDSKLINAMHFLFNNIYLVNNKESANEVCYKEKCIAVMTDGTIYDPKGSMTVGISEKEEITFINHNLINDLINEITTDQSSDLLLNDNLINELFNKGAPSLKGILLLEKLSFILNNLLFLINDFNSLIKLFNLIKEYNSIKEIKDKSIIKELKEKLIKEKKKHLINEKNKILKNNLINEINELNNKLRINEEIKEDLNNQMNELNLLISKNEENIKLEEIYSNNKKINYKLKNEIKQLIYEFNEIEFNYDTNNTTEKININNDLIKELNIPINKLLSINDDNTEYDCSLLNDYIKEYNSLDKIKKYEIDPSNLDLLEKNEKVLLDLENKINKLESDKSKINNTINKLKLESNKAVTNALDHLNKNLTKLISYFLPNMEILINSDYSLEINNGSVSINSLSGGQRSLVALCLLFTALSYNPSPFYLLDEVDAALDVKYCEQIGLILKKELNAQFVVVSLRDEMVKQGELILKVVLEDNKPIIKQITK